MRRHLWASVLPTAEEVAAPRRGDQLVSGATVVVMDRAFTVTASPEQVFPWLVQLGKGRAGWYLPRSVERLIPQGHRALRVLDPQWLNLTVGDVIPDYGGEKATFTVAEINTPQTLVFTANRGHTHMTWVLTLTGTTPTGATPTGATPTGTAHTGSPATRVHLRLRLGPVRHTVLARTLGGSFDAATIAGMAAGLRERLHDTDNP